MTLSLSVIISTALLANGYTVYSHETNSKRLSEEEYNCRVYLSKTVSCISSIVFLTLC